MERAILVSLPKLREDLALQMLIVWHLIIIRVRWCNMENAVVDTMEVLLHNRPDSLGGFTYCTLSEGDDEFLDMKNKLAFILGTSFNCHTSLRFGPCRHLYDDEYLDYQIAERYFRMYPQITFNDPCIQKVITWDYWSFLLSAPKLSQSIMYVFLTLLCTVFLV
jgi:hypothetical protein